jgi:hypothetical protein
MLSLRRASDNDPPTFLDSFLGEAMLQKSLKVSFLVGFCFMSLAGSAAFAWSDMGHEIVGGVAEQMINPPTQDFVRGILGVEPLSVAAVFPDHVRDDLRFGHREADPAKRVADDNDFSDYHFCDIPTGYDYDSKPKKTVKDCFGAIQGAIKLLKDTTGQSSRAEKMIALRYLVHIMGDITQPLHVGNSFDLGANACQIKVQENPDKPSYQMNFHAFWDDTMVNYLGSTYKAKYLNQYLAAFNKNRPEMLTAQAKATYAKGDLKSWLMEAQKIRENGLYPDAPGSMAAVPSGEEYKNRPYCLWFTDENASILGAGSVIQKDKIPTLGSVYEKKFAPIVEMQLLKGGLRLAAVLDQIASEVSQNSRADHPVCSMTTTEQNQVLSAVQSQFRNNISK